MVVLEDWWGREPKLFSTLGARMSMASPEQNSSQQNHAECVKNSLPFHNRVGSSLSVSYRQDCFVQPWASLGVYKAALIQCMLDTHIITKEGKLHGGSAAPKASKQH